MHPLAAKTVRHAMAAGARIDACEDFDALAALDRAARATKELPVWHVVDLLDRPVIVGEPDARGRGAAVLYRPSFAALEWIEDSASAWWDVSSKRRNCSVAWALANARDPDAFRRAATPRAAWRIVAPWIRGLRCSLTALFRAADRLMRPDGDAADAAGTKPGDPGADDLHAAIADDLHAAMPKVLARIIQECGGSEEKWMFGPLHQVQAAIDLIQRQDAAERAAIARAKGESVERSPDDPEVVAFVRWKKANDAFLKRFMPPPPEDACHA